MNKSIVNIINYFLAMATFFQNKFDYVSLKFLCIFVGFLEILFILSSILVVVNASENEIVYSSDKLIANCGKVYITLTILMIVGAFTRIRFLFLPYIITKYLIIIISIVATSIIVTSICYVRAPYGNTERNQEEKFEKISIGTLLITFIILNCIPIFIVRNYSNYLEKKEKSRN